MTYHANISFFFPYFISFTREILNEILHLRSTTATFLHFDLAPMSHPIRDMATHNDSRGNHGASFFQAS